ncbi:MAG: hypothetical protein CMJ81_09680 [Planctomycetaceae bacterium]|nr:hypothetical protein [Planctomycetaceae bacterium]
MKDWYRVIANKWFTRRIRLAHACILGLWCCALMCACNGHDGRQGLQGIVTLDGQPLPAGGIDFYPQPDTPGPTAGGQIVDGHFSVGRGGGTMAGTFRVAITALRKTGRQVEDPTAAMIDPEATSVLTDEYEQYIPARYNMQSELTAEVKEDGANTFEFQLSSQ